MTFENIPLEMRTYRQWVMWRFEDTEGKKPTKVPYSALTGRLASVTDSATWASFDECVHAMQTGWYAGIGFVLTENDPYSFIDLDDTKGDQTALDRQIKIFNEFNSYAERSPSGSGLHIIVKGVIPSGRRRSFIEVYSSLRYMTMTGDIYRNSPIADCNDLLNVLWGQMAEGPAATAVYAGMAEAKESDEEVYKRALSAANGDKFNDLFNGNWQYLYQSQSEADFALVDIVAFYTQNRAQIQRIFRASALGKREKAQRQDYVNYMLNKCFDRMLPPVDVDGLQNKLNEILAAKRIEEEQNAPSNNANAPQDAPAPAKPAKPNPSRDIYSLPPGLVGEIAQFIYAQAPRPVPEIALAGALGLVAGIAGRAFNVSHTGLNQYILLLAPTGCHAKGAQILMHDGSVKLVEDVEIGDKLMGPDSKPRKVLNLARGCQKMARIVPTKGESFVVNLDHILPLVNSENGKRENITIADYLNKSKWFKHCYKLQRTGVKFNTNDVVIDPWFLGALLGDGCFIGSPSLTGMDEEIHKEAEIHASKFGVKIGSVSQPKNNAAWQCRFTSERGKPNLLACELKRLGLWGKRADSKFIPEIYKRNSREVRLEVLAGLLDTDGSLTCNGYDFISKSERLAKDVAFIARSLGKEVEKRAQNGSGGKYYRVSISGDTFEIPVRLERKKAKPRSQKKSVLVTGFAVEILPEADFYGFALDSDHLYLTDDFIIHHNTGKEAITSGIDKLMGQVVRTVPAAADFIGPGEIASSQAIIKYMSRGPVSFTSVLGEFGIHLQQMASHNAPPHLLGLRRFMLDVYNKSGEGRVLKPSIYSDKDKNTNSILAPAPTFVGESTPEKFYEGLHEGLISEGLLPRFSTIEYHGDRPPMNHDHYKAQPSFELIDKLSTLCAHALMLNSQHRAIHVQFSPEADSIFKQFDEHCDLQINSSDREVRRHLWNRGSLKAMKLAATIAVGCNPYDPVISADVATWAINIVVADIRNITNRFDAGEIGVDNEETQQLTKAIEAIAEFIVRPWAEIATTAGPNTGNLHANKIVPYSFLHRRLARIATFRKDRIGATNAIKRVLKTLCERGDLQEMSRAVMSKEYGSSAVGYMISNPAAILKSP